uniref:Nudix hydrolase domain-containing protein n=1 Tax=Vannella robusta TaxID=1487602 RepID=A0A7S4MCQ3_9EUKA
MKSAMWRPQPRHIEFFVGADWRANRAPKRFLIGDYDWSLQVDYERDLKKNRKYSANLLRTNVPRGRVTYNVEDVEEVPEQTKTLVLESCGVLVASDANSLAVVRNINTKAARLFKFAIEERQEEDFVAKFDDLANMCVFELELLVSEDQTIFWTQDTRREWKNLNERLERYGEDIRNRANETLESGDVLTTPPFSLPKGNFNSWNENMFETATRELNEETGIRLRLEALRQNIALVRVNCQEPSLYTVIFIANELRQEDALRSAIPTDIPGWRPIDEGEFGEQKFFSEPCWSVIQSGDGTLQEAMKDFASRTAEDRDLTPFPWDLVATNFNNVV